MTQTSEGPPPRVRAGQPLHFHLWLVHCQHVAFHVASGGGHLICNMLVGGESVRDLGGTSQLGMDGASRLLSPRGENTVTWSRGSWGEPCAWEEERSLVKTGLTPASCHWLEVSTSFRGETVHPAFSHGREAVRAKGSKDEHIHIFSERLIYQAASTPASG